MRIGTDPAAYSQSIQHHPVQTRVDLGRAAPMSPVSPTMRFQNAGGEQFHHNPLSGHPSEKMGYGHSIMEHFSNDPDVQMAKRLGLVECVTCASRQYQDDSDDPGVSFKSAEHVAPEHSYAMVAAHEQEHVHREAEKAHADENVELISQSVTIHMATCPECGRMYAAGGETVTRTRHTPEGQQEEQHAHDLAELIRSAALIQAGEQIDQLA